MQHATYLLEHGITPNDLANMSAWEMVEWVQGISRRLREKDKRAQQLAAQLKQGRR